VPPSKHVHQLGTRNPQTRRPRAAASWRLPIGAMRTNMRAMRAIGARVTKQAH